VILEIVILIVMILEKYILRFEVDGDQRYIWNSCIIYLHI